jgi:hypothetical protein
MPHDVAKLSAKARRMMMEASTLNAIITVR